MDSQIASLQQITTELQKRLEFPYIWYNIQNQDADQQTNFIYDTLYFDDVLLEIEKRFSGLLNSHTLYNYALNRWYNFWSSVAVEKLFTQYAEVKPHDIVQHHTIDFWLAGIPFDHKTSAFPQKYPEKQAFAEQNPRNMIEWLYKNQSQENRKHHENRLFLMLFDEKGQHWQLKADLYRIAISLQKYFQSFSFEQLLKVQVTTDKLIWSDIIWVKR